MHYAKVDLAWLTVLLSMDIFCPNPNCYALQLKILVSGTTKAFVFVQKVLPANLLPGPVTVSMRLT